MKVSEIVELLHAEVLCGKPEQLDIELKTGFASDMMSDVLAYMDSDMLLLTGLATPHAIRTAEMLDLRVIVFVRAKHPTPEMIDMANEFGIMLIRTQNTMFKACGILYVHGLDGRGHIDG